MIKYPNPLPVNNLFISVSFTQYVSDHTGLYHKVEHIKQAPVSSFLPRGLFPKITIQLTSLIFAQIITFSVSLSPFSGYIPSSLYLLAYSTFPSLHSTCHWVTYNIMLYSLFILIIISTLTINMFYKKRSFKVSLTDNSIYLETNPNAN